MKQWFYVEQGERKGPIEEQELIDLLKSGRIGSDTLVWTQGMGEWKHVSEFADFVQYVSMAPPSPDDGDGRDGLNSESIFLHIPAGRLVLMSLATLGLYEVYWMYMNWRYIKTKEGLDIRPFWRAVFGVFFCYDLFKTIHEDEQANSIRKAEFSFGGLAIGWIVVMVAGNVMSRFGGNGMNAVAIAISLPSFLFFMPVQNYINSVNAAREPVPEHYPWSLGHIVLAVVGPVLWLLVVAGLALPGYQ